MKSYGTAYSVISNCNLPQFMMFGNGFIKTRLISLYQNVKKPYISSV